MRCYIIISLDLFETYAILHSNMVRNWIIHQSIVSEENSLRCKKVLNLVRAGKGKIPPKYGNQQVIMRSIL